MFKIALVILVAAPVIGLGCLLYSISLEYVRKLNRREEKARMASEKEPDYSWGRHPGYADSRYGRTDRGYTFGGRPESGNAYTRPTEYRGIGTGLDDNPEDRYR